MNLSDFKPPFTVNDFCAKGYTAGAPTYWIEDSEGNGVGAFPPPMSLAQEIADLLNRRENGK